MGLFTDGFAHPDACLGEGDLSRCEAGAEGGPDIVEGGVLGGVGPEESMQSLGRRAQGDAGLDGRSEVPDLVAAIAELGAKAGVVKALDLGAVAAADQTWLDACENCAAFGDKDGGVDAWLRRFVEASGRFAGGQASGPNLGDERLRGGAEIGGGRFLRLGFHGGRRGIGGSWAIGRAGIAAGGEQEGRAGGNREGDVGDAD